MNHKLFTLVAKESFSEDEVKNFCKNNFNLSIKDSKVLAENAVQLTISKYDIIKSPDIKKTLDLKKVDFCVQEKTDIQFKVLLCDMDATIIANETLDDLVKLTGVKTNIDETSKLAMEGKIDLKTTLKNRVELLKGHPKSLIEEVKNAISFNPGGDIMVRTLNSHGLISNLVTGGFEPISTYVGEKLGFHNVISNQFVFDKNNCFTGEYHLVNGEKNSKYKFMEKLSEVKNSILTQIKFTDLKTILFFLGIKESEFSK